MNKHFLLIVLIATLCISFNAFAIDARERRDFQKIEELFLKEDFDTVSSRCDRFLREHRDSRFRKSVRHLKEIAKEKLEYKGEEGIARESERQTGEHKTEGEIFYIVQIGAFKELNNANRLKRRLKRQKFESVILKVRSGDRIFYKVMAGKFRNLENAEALARNLNRKGYSAEIINEE